MTNIFSQEEKHILKNYVIPYILNTYNGVFIISDAHEMQVKRLSEKILYTLLTKKISSYDEYYDHFVKPFESSEDIKLIDYVLFLRTTEEFLNYTLSCHSTIFNVENLSWNYYIKQQKCEYKNPFYKKDLKIIFTQISEPFYKYTGEFFSKTDFLFKLTRANSKQGWMKVFACYVDNGTSLKLLKESRVIPSYFIKTHKFSEDELIEIIKNHKDFKSKSAVMGGSQDKRTNAANHILKWQTVSEKVLKTILEVSFPGEEAIFLKAMANREITMKNIEQTDEFICSLVEAGAKLNFVDTTNASDSTKLLIEVSK